MTSSSDVPARLAAVRETMHAEFTREHADPWIVAYSGGKDSTLLLQLAWEIAAAVPDGEPRRCEDGRLALLASVGAECETLPA